ncbi:MAG: hypothetical protein CL843_12520 [Crocinitomicaceae bacterium]|nr:hypothetical protein [Crocinitomicaceae bacterium]|tara:strand:+ start:2657 stop:3391 length:735 start_codon:yes stop_codon:yes gene_type:complete
MKKTKFLLSLSLVLFVSFSSFSQNLNSLKKALNEKISSGSTGDLTNNEVVSGLKEALEVGAEKAVSLASKEGGFSANELIRIPFPEEAESAKELALKVGMDAQVEQFEATMNEAAEKASAEAVEILKNAILGMSVQDGFDILNGGDTAATHFLRKSTYNQLFEKFSPIVESSLSAVDVTKYWNPIINTYNKNPFKKEAIDPDLQSYVTNKALDGLFTLIKEEEKEIRENPQARVTDLLKKVFGN